jgi:hypothetical protein
VILLQKKRLSVYCSLLNSKRFAATIAAIAFIAASLFATATVVGQSLANKNLRVSDPLNISTFLHPKKWVKLDYYGRIAFSPQFDKETRIIYLVVESNVNENKEVIKEKGDSKRDKEVAPLTEIHIYRDNKLQKYKKTFSSINYSLIEIQPVESGEHPGVMVLALGTESNKLYSGINIWIIEYYTEAHTISLTLLCKEDKFEQYKKAVETSFKSLIIF